MRRIQNWVVFTLISIIIIAIILRLAKLYDFAFWGSDSGEHYFLLNQLISSGTIQLEYKEPLKFKQIKVNKDSLEIIPINKSNWKKFGNDIAEVYEISYKVSSRTFKKWLLKLISGSLEK